MYFNCMYTVCNTPVGGTEHIYFQVEIVEFQFFYLSHLGVWP